MTDVDRWAKNPLIVLIALLLGIAASVATVLGFVLPRFDGPSAASPGAGPARTDVVSAPSAADGTPSPPADESPSAAETSPSAERVEIGSCVADGGLTPCRRAHDAEVIGLSGACDPTTLIGFLGGSVSVDVLSPDVRVAPAPLGGRSACLAQFPAPRTDSAQGAFARSDHGSWRWCRDTKRRQVTVPCQQPHDAEVVASTAARSPATPDCRAAAENFADSNWSELEATLLTRVLEEKQLTLCLVEARGANVLTDSIRGIGTRTLPVAPRSD